MILENENELNEEVEELKGTEISVKKEENENSNAMQFFSNVNDLRRNSNTQTGIFTNVTDKKQLFNLENNVDFLLNDCEGETIRVEKFLIKRYLKPMKNPEVDEETGEVIRDTEMSMSLVLVDNEGNSYATGSKLFAMNFMKYLELFSNEKFESVDIKILKKKYKDTNNKCLTFELV